MGRWVYLVKAVHVKKLWKVFSFFANAHEKSTNLKKNLSRKVFLLSVSTLIPEVSISCLLYLQTYTWDLYCIYLVLALSYLRFILHTKQFFKLPPSLGISTLVVSFTAWLLCNKAGVLDKENNNVWSANKKKEENHSKVLRNIS
jgi:hypothetical protein